MNSSYFSINKSESTMESKESDLYNPPPVLKLKRQIAYIYDDNSETYIKPKKFYTSNLLSPFVRNN